MTTPATSADNGAAPPAAPAVTAASDTQRLAALIFWLVVGVALLLGVFQAWAMQWLHDDIFVTLRYVDHWSRGLGLVCNVGERVEGYTHPLWLGLLMAAKVLGGDPVAWCVWLGLASYAGVLGLAAWVSWRMQPRGFFFVPVTALALMLHYEFRVWATGGLETMFFTFLLMAAFATAFFTRWPRRTRIAAAGALLTAAMAARPDGAVLWAMGNAIVLGTGWLGAVRLGASDISESAARRIRSLAGDLFHFNAALLFAFVPWMVWKVGYYGDLLPNTYYTKSGGGWSLIQGLWYMWTFLRAYPTTALFLLGIPALVSAWRPSANVGQASCLPQHSTQKNNINTCQHNRAAAAALAGMALYLGLFVIRVGGDYMFARMIIPALPFAWFIIEWLLIRTLRRRPAVLALAGVALPLVILGENHLRDMQMTPARPTFTAFIEHLRANRGVTNEHWFYTTPIFANSPLNVYQEQRWLGEGLRPFFEGEDVTVLFVAQNIAAYYSQVKYAIEFFGLTDRTIALSPPVERRVGHQKRPRREYLIERGVDFYFASVGELKSELYQRAWFQIAEQGPPFETTLYTYDRAMLERLREKSGGRFTWYQFEDWLDAYIRDTLPGLSPEQARNDYEQFRDYYFRWTPDPAREQQLKAKFAP